jgi:hypothetical protein
VSSQQPVIRSWLCWLNNTGFRKRESGKEKRGDKADSQGGENTFDVTAEDEAGNFSELDSITIMSCMPYTPILVSPSQGEADVPLMPELQTDAFSHPCDSTHQMTGWQISTGSDFSSLLLDVASPFHLTSVKVPRYGDTHGD